VGQCLAAAEEGPFFPDWEFSTLIGVDRPELALIRAAWPDVDLDQVEVRAAITNTLNNLTGYPHRKDAHWSDYIGAPAVDVERLLDKLLALYFPDQ
jgi:hypothetical protein